MSLHFKKNFRKDLSTLVQKYFRGHFCNEVNVFTSVSETFDSQALSADQLSKLEKFLQLFF